MNLSTRLLYFVMFNRTNHLAVQTVVTQTPHFGVWVTLSIDQGTKTRRLQNQGFYTVLQVTPKASLFCGSFHDGAELNPSVRTKFILEDVTYFNVLASAFVTGVHRLRVFRKEPQHTKCLCKLQVNKKRSLC